VIYLANLTIEEIVTNCIKYGFNDDGTHLIEITLRLLENEMALTVTDDGHAFNPLEAPVPNTHLPVEERPVGGLGILLLRRMSDRMDYVRANGKNHTTVRKFLKREGE
jgi:anti-sigma regulatory factor (Ser/Thr protein kinase)